MKQSKSTVCLSALVIALSAVLLFSCDELPFYISETETESSTEIFTDAQTVPDESDTYAAIDSSEPISEQTEPVETDAPPLEDVTALALYTDRYSEEYRSLGDEIEKIDTGFTGDRKTVRLRAVADGVRVTLEKIEYVALFDFYRPTEQIVGFDAEKGAVYEIACPAPGKKPEYRLVAEIDGCRGEYLIKRDTENKAEELVCGEWKPEEISLVSSELAIARSAAIAHAKYGDIGDDAVCREVLASAIAQRRSYEYTEQTEYFETEQWLVLAYLRAAYPGRDALPEQDGELLTYPETQDGMYRTVPFYYTGKAAASVFDICQNSDGSVNVRYDVIVYSDDAPPALSGRVVTLTPVKDFTSPFDYAVTDVRETDVEY